MAFFNFFRKKEHTKQTFHSIDSLIDALTERLEKITDLIADSLEDILRTDPQSVIEPATRLILTKDMRIGILTGQPEPNKFLRPDDLIFVFLLEEKDALLKWLNNLETFSDPTLQRAFTYQYAAKLATALLNRIQDFNEKIKT